MRPFTYARPEGAPEAVLAASANGDAVRYLGGGTNLVDLMRLWVELVLRKEHLAPQATARGEGGLGGPVSPPGSKSERGIHSRASEGRD